MAVTGSGTQADPYIVHSYSELKTISSWFSSYDNFPKFQTDKDTYVNLANDIDCNDYGDTFEWETIHLSGFHFSYSEVRWIRFDLCGHTIKNILIKNGNVLFDQPYTDSRKFDGYPSVRNGKILNVFNNGATNVFIDRKYIGKLLLENLSMSINCTGLTDNTFAYVKLSKCSVYIDGIIEHAIVYISTSDTVYVSNSDFFINGSVNYGTRFCTNNTSNVYDPIITNTRIRGSAIFKNGFCYNAKMSNCVIDIPMWMGSSTSYASPFDTGNNNNNTGVVNSDKVHDQWGNGGGYWNTGGMTKVTDAELHSAASLNAKGFNVVKVGG